MNYQDLAHVIKMGGTVMFSLLFLVALAYAFWPKNRSKFDRAASLPLDDNDHPSVEENHV